MHVFVLLLLANCILADQAQGVSIVVPLSAPPSAIPLDPSLVSFSIEQDRWTDWAGINSPNTYFLNTLSNLIERTGVPPWFRIGADSADRTDFSEHVQFSETIFPEPSSSTPYPEASNITVGADYYKLASHLPSGSRVIWGVNFGSNNITAAFLQARAVKGAFESKELVKKGVRLEAIEIGNEPDIYAFTGHRDLETWTIEEYVKEWTTFAENVSVAAGVSETGPKFLGLSFNLPQEAGGPFSPQAAFASGLLNSTEGKLINEVAQHRYSGSLDAIATLATMMSKTTIRANLSLLIDDIAAAHSRGLGYVLGETNSNFLHGEPGTSNAAGAAIWMIDYTLFAASLGIKRAHFHEGIGYRYNFIQPVTLTRSIVDASPLSEPLPPHVQPIYYGALVVTEAVGDSGVSEVVELSIDDEVLSGYAVFENNGLKRAVLINSEAYLTGDGERPTKNVTLSFNRGGPEKTGQTARLKRLVIGHADDTSGLTWAGQSFETVDAKPDGAMYTETLEMNNGNVTISISATEAVLLSFH